MQTTFMSPRPRLGPAAVLSAVVGLSAGCHIDLSAQAEARNQWTKTYTVERGATFELVNTNGRIEIAATDGDAIEVVAERIVKAATEERAREVLGGIEIRETASAGRVRLESRAAGMNIGVNRVVNYTVKLPRWTNVRIDTTNGDVRVDDLAGELRIEATNGRVEGNGLENGAVVDATNGAVSLSFAKLGAQGIECETTNGAITVALPADANADVSARVTNGRISTDDLDLDFTEESRRRIDGRLGSGGTRVRLETLNGQIRVRAARPAVSRASS